MPFFENQKPEHLIIFEWMVGVEGKSFYLSHSQWPATSWVHYTTSCNTQSSAPEDGQNNCPKHAELTGIINKPLLLHLVGCLYYVYFIIFFFLRLAKQSPFNPYPENVEKMASS